MKYQNKIVFLAVMIFGMSILSVNFILESPKILSSQLISDISKTSLIESGEIHIESEKDHNGEGQRMFEAVFGEKTHMETSEKMHLLMKNNGEIIFADKLLEEKIGTNLANKNLAEFMPNFEQFMDLINSTKKKSTIGIYSLNMDDGNTLKTDIEVEQVKSSEGNNYILNLEEKAES